MEPFFSKRRAVPFLALLLSSCALIFRSTIPDVGPPPDLRVEITPARLARGEYLARHVMACIDCHSDRDFGHFAGPVVTGTEGKGGTRFGKELGLPGTLYGKNITPAALGAWTDGEVARAITSGVGRDGEAFFPMMPYPNYRQIATEDLYSLIAYVRSLKPITNEVPKRELNFPLKYVARTLPRPYEPAPPPNPSDTVARGKYLVIIASCADCHTPMNDRGQPLPGMYMAGGNESELPWGTLRAANITPDVETGIGRVPREVFIKQFKGFSTPEGKRLPNGTDGFNTDMPWTEYGGMTEGDLGAIYDYLRTIPPVKNAVRWFTPPGGPANP
ncbi:MAG: cytochrome C [Nitrospirae bacterium]|nr:cytochrome C [Nitrospirota bacterium]